MTSEAKILKEQGFKVTENKIAINFEFNGNHVVFWKKSKWFSGKSVNDGRGLKNLLKELGNKNPKAVAGYSNNPEAYNHLIGIFQKHTQLKLSEEAKSDIIENMKRRFNINLVNQ